jgi:hypothetical protein
MAGGDFSTVIVHAPSCRALSLFGECNIRRNGKQIFLVW